MSDEPCVGCAALKEASNAYARYGEASRLMDNMTTLARQADASLDLVQEWANSASEAADALGRLLTFYAQPSGRHLHLVEPTREDI